MVERPTTTVLVALRIADRPGALASAAGRIGALRGDLVGIEILERGHGSVVDELVVELPDDIPLDLLARELAAEDDIEVLAIDELGPSSPYDPRVNPYEVAAILSGSVETDELLTALCQHTRRAIRSDWACVIDGGDVVGRSGPAPDPAWLLEADADGHGLGGDTIWMPMPAAGATLAVGRPGRPFRARERQNAAALARIADALHKRIRLNRRLRSMAAHPACGPISTLDG